MESTDINSSKQKRFITTSFFNNNCFLSLAITRKRSLLNGRFNNWAENALILESAPFYFETICNSSTRNLDWLTWILRFCLNTTKHSLQSFSQSGFTTLWTAGHYTELFSRKYVFIMWFYMTFLNKPSLLRVFIHYNNS